MRLRKRMAETKFDINKVDDYTTLFTGEHASEALNRIKKILGKDFLKT